MSCEQTPVTRLGISQLCMPLPKAGIVLLVDLEQAQPDDATKALAKEVALGISNRGDLSALLGKMADQAGVLRASVFEQPGSRWVFRANRLSQRGLDRVAELRGESSPPRSGFPRSWNLFGYLLPHWVRDRVYEPARQDLLEDYLLARRMCRTTWSSRWLAFCFTVRSAVLWVQSLYAWAGDKMDRALRWLLTVVGGETIIEWLWR